MTIITQLTHLFKNQIWGTDRKVIPGCLGNKTTNDNQTCFAHMEFKRWVKTQRYSKSEYQNSNRTHKN